MESRCAGHGAIAQQLHVVQRAGEVGGDSIADLGESNQVVLGLIEMNRKIHGLLMDPAVLAAIDDHGAAVPSGAVMIASCSARNSTIASWIMAGSTSNPEFADRAS